MASLSTAASVDPTPTNRSLLMIPGPTEYSNSVLTRLGEPSLSHVSPLFINEFSDTLKSFRILLGSTVESKSQPIILSGGGTLGWELIIANLTESSERALCINTGYFSDSFSDCASTYNLTVDQLSAPIGNTVSTTELIKTLKENINKPYKIILLTQVDTSTAVLNNIQELSSIIRQYSPESLIAVDGVCSFGSEFFEFDAWGIDAALTCSQKGLSIPPGLSLTLLSNRALSVYSNRTSKVQSYYSNLKYWLPIMKAYELKQPSYFSTPNTNLIRALLVAFNEMGINSNSDSNSSNSNRIAITNRIQLHIKQSNAIKSAFTALGLKQVPIDPSIAAHTLSAIYYPNNISGPALLSELSKRSIIVAGGLHKDIKAQYFRVGHMGISIAEGRTDLLKVITALEDSLSVLGYKFNAGAGISAYKSIMNLQ